MTEPWLDTVATLWLHLLSTFLAMENTDSLISVSKFSLAHFSQFYRKYCFLFRIVASLCALFCNPECRVCGGGSVTERVQRFIWNHVYFVIFSCCVEFNYRMALS